METAGVLPISCRIYIISVKRRWLYFRLSELRKKFPFYRPMFVKPCCTTRLLGGVKPGLNLPLGWETVTNQSFCRRNPEISMTGSESSVERTLGPSERS